MAEAVQVYCDADAGSAQMLRVLVNWIFRIVVIVMRVSQ